MKLENEKILKVRGGFVHILLSLVVMLSPLAPEYLWACNIIVRVLTITHKKPSPAQSFMLASSGTEHYVYSALQCPLVFQNIMHNVHNWKGLCHAIRHLKVFKKLKGIFDSKNNGLVLLLKTILWYWNCFLSSVACDGKDGNWLKLEKIGPIFSSFDAMSSKITKKIDMFSTPWQTSCDIFLIVLQEHFVYGWRH